MAIYKENLIVERRKNEAQLAFYLRRGVICGQNKVLVADAACKFCQIATGLVWNILICCWQSLGRKYGLGWGNNRALKGYDGNKKVKGIKRHVVTDKNGFLLAVMATVANIHDSKAVLLLMRMLKEMLYNIRTIIADGGYRGRNCSTGKKIY